MVYVGPIRVSCVIVNKIHLVAGILGTKIARVTRADRIRMVELREETGM